MPVQVPSFGLPGKNRQVLLSRRPSGVPQAGDFTMSESAVPKAGTGQALVRNIYLSVDPAQRGWASAEANYSAPVPLGSPMRALAVGVIVDSQHPDLKSGEFLYGWFGWQDYALIEPSQIIMRATQDMPLDSFASLLGINGVTAYLALTECGRPVRGETLAVSTAAGSVGSFVGQIGKHLGCRTVGLTGDDAKVVRCKQSYGYDEAINYKTTDIAVAIAAAAPKGVDVYFDNVGGSILDTVLRLMAMRGRVVQCGTASISTWLPPPTGLRNEREVLTRRLTWSGFIIFDYLSRYKAAADELTKLHHAGAIKYDIDLSDDIARAPHAIAALYAGENQGKKLIYVG